MRVYLLMKDYAHENEQVDVFLTARSAKRKLKQVHEEIIQDLQQYEDMNIIRYSFNPYSSVIYTDKKEIYLYIITKQVKI